MNLSQKVAVNTSLLLVSRLAVAASGGVGVAVSTRYLGPDHFGQLTVAIVFVSIFGFFTDAGIYTIASREIAKRPDEEEKLIDNVFSMGIILSFIAVLLSLGVMLVAYGDDHDTLIRTGVLILAVQMLATPIGGTTVAFLGAHQRAFPVAVAGIVCSVVFTAGLFLVVGLDLGYEGLAACFAVTGVINHLLPFAIVRRKRPRLSYDRVLWRQMIGWALPQAGVIVLAVLYFRIDTFLLSFMASDAEVARYGVAYRVVEVITVFPVFFTGTLFPEIARQEPHSSRLNELVQGAFSSLALVAVPLVIVFAVFARDVVTVAGGPKFSNAAPMLAIMIVAVALLFLSNIYFQTLVALNRQGNVLKVLLAVLVLNVALNVVLIPSLGARGAAIALIVTEGLALVLARRVYAAVGRVPRFPNPYRLAAAAALTAGVVLLFHQVLPASRFDVRAGSSFTDALEPLAAFAAGAVLTLGLWVGGLMLLRAIPDEVRGALAALRHRPASDPVPVSTGVNP